MENKEFRLYMHALAIDLNWWMCQIDTKSYLENVNLDDEPGSKRLMNLSMSHLHKIGLERDRVRLLLPASWRANMFQLLKSKETQLIER